MNRFRKLCGQPENLAFSSLAGCLPPESGVYVKLSLEACA
jgi:hypothetical protein